MYFNVPDSPKQFIVVELSNRPFMSTLEPSIFPATLTRGSPGPGPIIGCSRRESGRNMGSRSGSISCLTTICAIRIAYGGHT